MQKSDFAILSIEFSQGRRQHGEIEGSRAEKPERPRFFDKSVFNFKRGKVACLKGGMVKFLLYTRIMLPICFC